MKPENLLFDKNFILKIADFGFSTLLQGRDGSGYNKTILGTESLYYYLNNNLLVIWLLRYMPVSPIKEIK